MRPIGAALVLYAGGMESMQFHLPYQPPFDWDGLLDYFSGRAIVGVESISDGCYTRTVSLHDAQGRRYRGWISVAPAVDGEALTLTLSDDLAEVAPQCVAQVRAMFDLDADPVRINAHLGDLAAGQPGLRVPGAWDGFEAATRAVLGQLISVQAATTLVGRVVDLANDQLETPWSSLCRCFPLAHDFLDLGDDALGRCGISRRSVAALQSVARAITEGELALSPGADLMQARERLLAIRGIGDWTFQYIALRALRWPDAFLAGDLGVRKAMGLDKLRDVERAAEVWRPWRSYAVAHLWRSLK